MISDVRCLLPVTGHSLFDSFYTDADGISNKNIVIVEASSYAEKTTRRDLGTRLSLLAGIRDSPIYRKR